MKEIHSSDLHVAMQTSTSKDVVSDILAKNNDLNRQYLPQGI